MAILTFAKHFIPKSKGPFEFFDIPIDDTDIEAFIDPFQVYSHKGRLATIQTVYDTTTAFLKKLNKSFVLSNNRPGALLFLSHLHEPNEIHLGYSSDNEGKAVSNDKAALIFDALRNNKLARAAGLTVTNEAHNVLLLIDGIGPDNVSDITANICRSIFAAFTLRICTKYGIATSVHKIEFYDPSSQSWSSRTAQLPSYNNKPIILVPQNIVSKKRDYVYLYNRFIASNYLSVEIMNGRISIARNPKMIHTSKKGIKKPVIKEILNTLKKPKKDLTDFVGKYKKSLDEFRDYVKDTLPPLQ